MTDVRSVDDPQGAALLVLFLPRSCHGNVQYSLVDIRRISSLWFVPQASSCGHSVQYRKEALVSAGRSMSKPRSTEAAVLLYTLPPPCLHATRISAICIVDRKSGSITRPRRRVATSCVCPLRPACPPRGKERATEASTLSGGALRGRSMETVVE